MGTNGPAFRSRFKYSRFRADLGQRMGYSPSKRFTLTNSITNVQDKTLSTTKMVAAEYSDTDSVMDARSGRLCDVIGVKFRAWLSLKDNLVETNQIWNNPIQVRWALINPKDNAGVDTDITSGGNFFMATNPEVDDSNDFPATGNCFSYMNRKINTRKYGVLQQGTFILSNDPASTNTRVETKSKKFISLWIPIKRQMKWANTNVGSGGYYPNANIHFVFWYTTLGDKDTPQKFGSGDTPIDFTHEHVTYFRNAEVLA
jgi:hypothetical protein